jgi:hypothetical protein
VAAHPDHPLNGGVALGLKILDEDGVRLDYEVSMANRSLSERRGLANARDFRAQGEPSQEWQCPIETRLRNDNCAPSGSARFSSANKARRPGGGKRARIALWGRLGWHIP